MPRRHAQRGRSGKQSQKHSISSISFANEEAALPQEAEREVFSLANEDAVLRFARKQGSCPMCCPHSIGEVDNTLGSCASAPSCLSSYDDRPGHFITPWEYSNGSRRAAMQKLVDAVQTVRLSVLRVRLSVLRVRLSA
eukprot:352225-Chlamydomonas_euryale.AAC.7